ncbi:MAG: transcription elongation factor GreA [Oscillospiraceae bacterium]|jgi:transcription elongation factor GreA|nr:transcription elongation factor GreA [Oscillospiraceae bacterium]
MAKKEVLITKEGLVDLEKELEFLKTVKRKEIAGKIKAALSFGDLSENSEYDEAKNEQAMVESRIATVESMLQNVKIIDENELSTEIIKVGSKVTVKDDKYNETASYKIVGSSETNPSVGKISDESPLGMGLVGHRVGDKVNIEAPGGIINYEVIKISK